MTVGVVKPDITVDAPLEDVPLVAVPKDGVLLIKDGVSRVGVVAFA